MRRQKSKTYSSLFPQAGFTLVEIAIALVIIGLLITGIIKGREMVRQARVKKFEAMVQDIRTAVNTYYRSLGHLPGETPPSHDGRIIGTEVNKVFPDLVAQQLITGNPTDTTRKHPFDPANGDISVQFFSTMNENYIVTINLDKEVIEQLDKKYDDGVATTGAIRATVTGNKGTLYLPL